MKCNSSYLFNALFLFPAVAVLMSSVT